MARQPLENMSGGAHNPIGTQLRLEMKKRGINSAELAKRAEVKTSFIYDIISGKSANPSTVKLARVAEMLGVSLTVLIGSGEGFGEYTSIESIMVESASVVSRPQKAQQHFRKDWIREHLRAEPRDLRMLLVRGDSMEPTLYHNDAVLVDTARRAPSPPGIFVLFDGFGLVAKRLEFIRAKNSRMLRVGSDNAKYATYERSPEELSIIGRIVWFSREI